MTRTDPVTPDVADVVFRRDRGCMIVRLVPDVGPCYGRWGLGSSPTYELMHVKDQPRLGVRAPSDPAHLAVGCSGHHHSIGGRRDVLTALRAYLQKAYHDRPAG